MFVEIGLRIAGVGFLRQWDHDPERGLVAVANQAGWYCLEGCAYNRTNSAGFRDDERVVHKQAGTVRIALLGDSFVQAREVAKEERFGEILEARLNASGRFKDRVEVLNFGVAGYGTADELLTFRYVAKAYSPDIVLVAFFAGNDIINNVKTLQRNTNRPYLVLENGALKLDTSFRQDPGHVMTWQRRLAYWAIDRSRLLQVVYRARERFQGTGVHVERAEVAESAGFEEVGINRMVLAAPSVPKWEHAWATTEAILSQLHREVEAEGARLLVVTLTMGPQVHPDAAMRERLRARLDVPDLFYPDDRIRRTGEANGFPVLTLARPFQERADTSGAYFHGFENTKLGTGHWNAAGHRLAADLIAAEIDRLTQTAWWSRVPDPAVAAGRSEVGAVR
jgi:hypothetical protein